MTKTIQLLIAVLWQVALYAIPLAFLVWAIRAITWRFDKIEWRLDKIEALLTEKEQRGK